MAFINLNGKLVDGAEPALRAHNRSFRYGYGLFETLLFSAGEIRLREYHWARLWKGMEQLQFDIPKHFRPEMLEEEMARVVKKNGLERLARVRLQVFPGNGGLYDGDGYKPEFLIECFPLEEHVTELNEMGLTMGIASGITRNMDSLANLKTSSGLQYAMAARQAKQNKWNDAFLLNNSGHIAESSIANVFWLKNGQIHTPPLSEGCVAGVMRAYLIDKAQEKGIAIVQKPLPVAELLQAEEVFLTNAIRGIRWVKSIENAVFSAAGTQSFSAIIF